MEITQLDIWLEKITRGWKIEDAPEYLREELKKRLANEIQNRSHTGQRTCRKI